MKIRLVGSYLISGQSDFGCRNQSLAILLGQLPSHCFVQTQYPYDDLTIVALVYSYDENFDFNQWMDECFEA